MAMYEGFKQARIQTSDPEVQINLRDGGGDPPVLLLHGDPLTLARSSGRSAPGPRLHGGGGGPPGLRRQQQAAGPRDQSNYTFRQMAQDQVDVMRARARVSGRAREHSAPRVRPHLGNAKGEHVDNLAEKVEAVRPPSV